LGSLKYLAESGANSVTFYETAGWAGLMERDGGPPLPRAFPSAAGTVFPLYHVFAEAAEYAGGTVSRVISSDPLRAEALLLQKNGRRRLLLANAGTQEESLVLPPELSGHAVRVLDARSFREATNTPERWRRQNPRAAASREARLAPYGVVTLELT
jgi:hypothetical protein